MWAWPDLVLTDYERKYVRIYKTTETENGKKKTYPGVLRRVYKLVLNNRAAVNTNKNLPMEKTSGQVQIARRSRVFALSFSGNIDAWRLQITNASGTTYTTKTSRPSPAGTPFANQKLDPMVSAMLPSNLFNAESMGNLATNPYVGGFSPGIGPDIGLLPFVLGKTAPSPMLIDPNWLLLPNETLIFNGTPVPFSVDPGTEEPPFDLPLTLTIGVHVWEFPGMGRVSEKDRETH